MEGNKTMSIILLVVLAMIVLATLPVVFAGIIKAINFIRSLF
jgi:hypothetical protein